MTHRNFGGTGFLRIESGIHERLPFLIGSLVGSGRVHLITDSNVLRIHGARMQRALVLAGCDTVLLEVPPGEGTKSRRFLSSLHTRLLVNGVQRGDLIIALGGGVVGDLAGFAAATVLRGISYIHVPTTLLAQVDSSIGGKVGINHPLGKNLIGAFHPPVGIFTDPSLLNTLSDAEFRNGLAEVVKIAFARDPGFFRWLEGKRRAIAARETRVLDHLVRRSANLKAAVVAKDGRDESLRRILNFGHTIGHAIETASSHAIPHGKAVSIGMVVESQLAVDLGMLDSNARVRLIRLLRDFRLPVAFPGYISKHRFFRALSLDKKRDDGQRLSLPRRIGKVIPGVGVTRADLLKSVTGNP